MFCVSCDVVIFDLWFCVFGLVLFGSFLVTYKLAMHLYYLKSITFKLC